MIPTGWVDTNAEAAKFGIKAEVGLVARLFVGEAPDGRIGQFHPIKPFEYPLSTQYTGTEHVRREFYEIENIILSIR